MPQPLSAAFLSKLRAPHPGIDPAAREGLEKELSVAVDRAREAWPGVEFVPEVYAAYLGERIDPRGNLLAALRKMRTSDLCVACACASGDEAAIAAFDAAYLEGLHTSLASMNLPRSALEEAKQVLRHTLFVRRDARPPKICEYRGRGELRGWVRAAAVRATFRVMRQPKGQVEVDAAVLGNVPASGDLELAYLRRTYGPAFGDGLREAFAALPVEDRNLLRHHFGHGLSIDDLSTLYKVHRATAARRLAAARARLAERARETLAVRFGVSQSEVPSLVRLIASQLDVTLGALLGRSPRNA